MGDDTTRRMRRALVSMRQREEQHDSFLEAATAYSHLGFVVIPLFGVVPDEDGTMRCACGKDDCKNQGKHPTVRFKALTTPSDGLHAVAKALDRRVTNLGIRTGPESNLFVIDLDNKEGRPGIANFTSVATRLGLPEADLKTLSARTGSDGRHLYFRMPLDGTVGNGANVLAPGVDHRGASGYVVAPPSVHKSGGVYEWIGSLQDPILRVPPTLVEAIRGAQGGGARSASASARTRPPTKPPATTTECPSLLEFEEFLRAGSSQTEDKALQKTCFRYMELRFGKGDAVPKGEGHDFWLTLTKYMWLRWPLSDADALAALLRPGLKARQASTDDERDLEELAEMIRGLQRKFPPAKGGGRRPIQVNVADFHVLVDEIVAALARLPDGYQRGRCLVLVDGDMIVQIAKEPLAVHASRVARFFVEEKAESGSKRKYVQPPAKAIGAVHKLRRYPGIRELAGITDIPILRADGSLFSSPGYDELSKLLYRPRLEFKIPAEPTEQDVLDAKALLDELFCDVPFEQPSDKAAALSALFTLVARPAFTGPAPMHYFGAAVAGAAKGLVAETIGYIAHGRWPSVTPLPSRNEEMAKLLTAVAIAADPLLILDNVSTDEPLHSPALDAALTATRWKSRILGESRVYDGPFSTIVFMTGNNVHVRGDTGRRVVPVRIKITEAKPELRQNFLHPELKEWVEDKRADLLSAVLVLLKTSLRAGVEPSSSFGSFGGWNKVVRVCIEHIWGADPLARQAEYRALCDDDEEAFERFVAAWMRFRRPVTAGEALWLAKVDEYRDVRDAIQQACPTPTGDLPSAARLGAYLKSIRERPTTEETCMRMKPERARQRRWWVSPTWLSSPVDERFLNEFLVALHTRFGAEPFVPEGVVAPGEEGLRRALVAIDRRLAERGSIPPGVVVGLLRTADPERWVCMESEAAGVWSVRPATGSAFRRLAGAPS